jgi:hypothetical protein
MLLYFIFSKLNNKNKNQIKNNFQNLDIELNSTYNKMNIFDTIFYLLGFIITGYALYLSFSCNKGFHLGSFLIALFFSPIYLIYRLAVPCKS